MEAILILTEIATAFARDELVRVAGAQEFAGDERGFFNEADKALYAAKAQGKDCVVAANEG